MITLALSVSSCVARNARVAAVDAIIEREMAVRMIPGLAIVVQQDGELLHSAGYGTAVVEHEVPVHEGTVFEIASVTKTLTAACVLLLVEEGKIRLEDPIGQYLESPPEAWQEARVHNLLSHTSGLPTIGSDFRQLENNGWPLDVSVDAMYAAAKADPVASKPGERYLYSDVGYFLLGMIIERVSGQTFRDFLSERIFEPLEMDSSTVIDQWAIVPHRAQGYTLRDGALVRIRRDSQIELSPHFGVLSTALDLAKWDRALTENRLLKESTRQRMMTPATLNDGSATNYGLGWAVTTIRGHRVEQHTGITGTEFFRFPDDGLTVIVLTNLGYRVGGDTVNAWGIARTVAELFIESLARPEPKDLPLNAEGQRRYVGVYRYEDGATNEIQLRDGKLYLGGRLTDGRLLYEGGDVFVLEAEDLELTFQKEDDRVTGFTLRVAGFGEYRARRLGPRE